MNREASTPLSREGSNPRTESGHRHRWAILAVLCLSLVVISIDTLILNLALPSIQTELGASGTQLQWTVDAYTLCFGGLLLLSGSLADRFGRRLTLTLGLLVFLGCSLAAAYADTSGALILARAGMGVGAAMIMPATLAIIKDVFPAGAERARAIGVWAAAAALGVPLGPVVGGLLLEHFWWGAIFLVNVPLVALALVAGMLLIPESRTARHPGLDLAGTLLSVAGLGILVYGLVEASRDGWTGWTSLGPVAVGALLLVAFVRHERRTARPMLAPELWHSRAFTGSAVAIAALSFAMYGVLFVLTQYLQFVLAHDPLAAGLRLLPVAAVMLTAPLAPHLVQRLGLNTVVATGLALTVGALLLASGAGRPTENAVMAGLAVLGLGMGLTMPAATDAMLAAAPSEQAGAGAAMTDASMQIGGTLGIAVIGSALSTSYRGGLPDLGAAPPAAADAISDSIGRAMAVTARIGGESGATLWAAARAAFGHAFGEVLLIGAWAAVLGVLVAALVLPRRGTDAVSPPLEVAPADGPATYDRTRHSAGPRVSVAHRSGSLEAGPRPMERP